MTHFILPDICDYPEAGNSLFPSNIDENSYYEILDRSIKTLDLNLFCKTYEELVSHIKNYVDFNQKEISILQEQKSRVISSATTYFQKQKTLKKREELEFTQLYENLEKNGCSGLQLSKKSIDSINNLLEKDIRKLEAIGDNDPKPHFYDRFVTYNKQHNSELFDVLSQEFEKHKVFSSISKYHGTNKKFSLHHVSLQIATSTDKHHYQTLKDTNITTKLISLHMDPKFDVMKSLVYLNHVDEDTGPFTTIPGSNKWSYDMLERIVACGNSIGNYLDSPSHRKVLRSFPKRLRKNVIIGRYILDESDTSKFLIKGLHEFLSEECNCIIFDPTNVFHRGGLCKTKNRINLQIVMR